MSSLEIDSIDLDFSRRSVVQAIMHVATIDFRNAALDDSSRNQWYVRLGYYFGESLRRVSNKLHWATGEVDTALQNHPVISGFPSGVEAPVISICRNLIYAVNVLGQPLTRIDVAVQTWFDDASRWPQGQ